MELKTKFHEQVTIGACDILSFPQGIPGFESEKEFVILDLTEGGPYKVLQSIKNQWVAFIMVNPWLFEANYEFDLSEDVLKTLEVHEEKDLEIYNLLTLGKNLENTTMNLVAPIVIHKKKHQGMQIVLEHTHYTTKHPLGLKGC